MTSSTLKKVGSRKFRIVGLVVGFVLPMTIAYTASVLDDVERLWVLEYVLLAVHMIVNSIGILFGGRGFVTVVFVGCVWAPVGYLIGRRLDRRQVALATDVTRRA